VELIVGERAAFWPPIIAFSIVLVVRWIFIGKFGVDVPYWDQWGDEVKLYTAFLNGNLNMGFLFSSHNEHRIVITRLFNLALFWLNGGWNPLLGMYAQAVIPSLTVAFIVHSFIAQSKRYSILSYILTLIVFASPIVHENLLWGFQSQFFFQVLFSMLALRFAVEDDLKSVDYLKILLFCILASLSNGGGFTVFFVVALIWVYRTVFSDSKRITWFVSSAFALILCVAFSLLIVEVKGHDFLKSTTFNQFFSALFVNLGWPDTTGNGFGFFGIWIPSILILLRQLVKNRTLSRNELFCLGLLAWVGIMAVATAYSRRYLGNRYGDYLLLYLPAGIFLFDSYIYKTNILKFKAFAFLIKAAAIFGIVQISLNSLGSLNYDFEKKSLYARNLNAALVQENQSPGRGIQFLSKLRPHSELPHPSAQTIWNGMKGSLEPYMPGAIKIPERIGPLQKQPIPFRTVPDSVSLLPTQSEMGTFLRSDSWTGSIQSHPLVLKKDRFDLWVAGGCLSQSADGLDIVLRFLPSNEEMILNSDSNLCLRLPETWRLVSMTTPENSTHVTVVLNDRSVSKNGWLAVGGVSYSNRFDHISRVFHRWANLLD
jgi:hypothetical protein